MLSIGVADVFVAIVPVATVFFLYFPGPKVLPGISGTHPPELIAPVLFFLA